MNVETKILTLIRFNYPMITTIDELYRYCHPHGQALVERKCRLLKEKGFIDIAKIGSHNKITAYKLCQTNF